MTQEEILEYNTFCAEFLGWESAGPGFPVGYWGFNNDKIVLYEHMLFHSDWNWIMEVVEAIEKAGKHTIMNRDLYSSFDIGRQSIKFYFSPNNEYLLQLELKQFLSDEPWIHTMYKYHIVKEFDFKSKGKKEAVVQAINQFLIWHKEQTR